MRISIHGINLSIVVHFYTNALGFARGLAIT